MSNSRLSILLVDLNEPLASRLTEAIEPHCLHTASCCADEVLTVVAKQDVTTVVVSLSETTSGEGLEVLRAIRRIYPNLRLLVASGRSSEALALSVFCAGATDHLPHLGSVEEVARQIVAYRSEAPILNGAEHMIGDSEKMRDICSYIRKVAATNSNVLITDETGTGKELVASLIHGNSARAGEPLVCINCAAIPDTLLESELFGYERGAFTGAHLSTPGKIEGANGGTAFSRCATSKADSYQGVISRLEFVQRKASSVA